jgi:site-specific recombinase XerD
MMEKSDKKDKKQPGRKSLYRDEYSNQVLKLSLLGATDKEIADFCGIDKDITTHTARHTFATTVTLANGVALTNVARMLGHSSTRMTEHYARVLNQNICSDMKKVQSKISLTGTY